MDAAPRRLPVYEDVHGHLTGRPSVMVSTINACGYAEVSQGARTIQMLGHSMNAVALQKNGVLTCPFTVERESDYVITVALIPTHPLDGGDLRFSVAVDDSEPTVFSLKEPFRSEQWKLNVLSGQAHRSLTLHIPAGKHKLTVRALDDHIIVDQILMEN
jgi:hypothetical protein